MRLAFPLPVPRLFDDPGRCAAVTPGVLRAWVPVRIMVGDGDARLMVGVPWDLRPISEPQCYPEALSIPRDLWFCVRWSDLGRRVIGPDRGAHPDGPCRWCGFYADAAPVPPYETAPVAEVVLVGRTRRRGESCWGKDQTVHAVWLPGWCTHPERPDLGGQAQPTCFVGGLEGPAHDEGTEGVALCRLCAHSWPFGDVLDADELATAWDAPVRWNRGDEP